MPDPATPRISSRKQPKQARSTELVSAILEAAIHILAKEGAQRFTTARVAEKAGVSVGSLYQYFPNKAAILFRLQRDEWQRTTALLGRILADTGTPPLERVRTLVHAFVQSECEEAEMRIALHDAAPLYRDAPEAVAARASGDAVLRTFLREALPEATEPVRDRAGALMKTTLSEVGKHISETVKDPAEIGAAADALADMFCAYLASLDRRDPAAS